MIEHQVDSPSNCPCNFKTVGVCDIPVINYYINAMETQCCEISLFPNAVNVMTQKEE